MFQRNVGPIHVYISEWFLRHCDQGVPEPFEYPCLIQEGEWRKSAEMYGN